MQWECVPLEVVVCLQIRQNRLPSSSDNNEDHDPQLSLYLQMSCCSCKLLARWAWSGCSKPQEEKSMTQWSPRNRFALPQLTLSSPLRDGVSSENLWMKEAEGKGNEEAYIQPTLTATYHPVPWIKRCFLLLVILVCRQWFKNPWQKTILCMTLWSYHQLITNCFWKREWAMCLTFIKKLVVTTWLVLGLSLTHTQCSLGRPFLIYRNTRKKIPSQLKASDQLLKTNYPLWFGAMCHPSAALRPGL